MGAELTHRGGGEAWEGPIIVPSVPLPLSPNRESYSNRLCSPAVMSKPPSLSFNRSEVTTEQGANALPPAFRLTGLSHRHSYSCRKRPLTVADVVKAVAVLGEHHGSSFATIRKLLQRELDPSLTTRGLKQTLVRAISDGKVQAVGTRFFLKTPVGAGSRRTSRYSSRRSRRRRWQRRRRRRRRTRRRRRRRRRSRRRRQRRRRRTQRKKCSYWCERCRTPRKKKRRRKRRRKPSRANPPPEAPSPEPPSE